MSAAGTSFINTCGHIDKPHAAKGMCQSCYDIYRGSARGPSRKKLEGNATCHSDRPMYHTDGLCKSCYHVKRTYNADFVTMYVEQQGCCKLCLASFSESSLVLDHDHLTDIPRGLVCHKCNVVIKVAEDPLLNAALVYISSNSSKHGIKALKGH